MQKHKFNKVKPFLVVREDGLHFYKVGQEFYLSHSSLKQIEGWSDARIASYFPQACLLAPNPHHERGAPMRLYSFDKIKQETFS